MEELTNNKLKGKAIAKVKVATPQQIWPFLEDFCSFHKWLPSLETCYQVKGVYGQPGLIRYCASTIGEGEGEKAFTTWALEKLIEIDPIQRCLSYEIVDNNMGFKSYIGTWRVIAINGDDQPGCEIEWSFVTDPIDGWKYEDFLSYIENSLEGVMERMEKAALESTC